MSEGFIYVIHAVGTTRVKIGFAQKPGERQRELQTGSPFPLIVVGTCKGSPDLERRVHSKLEDYRCIGEWFELEPQEALSFIQQVAKEDEISIYDVPSANLNARAEAYTLLKHPDEAVQASAQRIIDLLTGSIRAMGREDVGVLIETAADAA